MYGVIVQPITNDTTPANVESYGDIVDMDHCFDKGFSRDFCDGQTSPVPPRWADDQAGMLYTYDRRTAEMFQGILREDVAARAAGGQLAPSGLPSWASWSTGKPTVVTPEMLDDPDILQHRKDYKPETISDDWVVQFAEGRESEGYGEHVWVLKDELPTIPDDLVNWTADYYEIPKSEAWDLLNPTNIVNSGGAWDDVDFVKDLSSAMYEREELSTVIGYRLRNGAIVLDPLKANLQYVLDDLL